MLLVEMADRTVTIQLHPSGDHDGARLYDQPYDPTLTSLVHDGRRWGFHHSIAHKESGEIHTLVFTDRGPAEVE